MSGSVLILGAAGFIGTTLRASLGPRYRLVSVDQVPLASLADGRAPLHEEFIQLDLGEKEHIDDLFRRLAHRVDDLAGVIDLVAYYDFRDEPDPRYEAIEVGLDHFLTQVNRRLPPEVPFIYASSMAAMAPTEPGRAQTPHSPRLGAWQYPAHKIRCEQILESAAVPQPRVELVLAAVYSPWCELVPLYHQLERIRRRSPEAFFYPGPTDRGLTYVHVDDVADAFGRAIGAFTGGQGVHRLLVGEARPLPYGEIHRVASERLLGGAAPLLRVPKLFARGGASLLAGTARALNQRRFVQPWMVPFAGEHFEFDISETQRTLGWTPRYGLGEELGDICDRARSHPAEWRRRNEARPW